VTVELGPIAREETGAFVRIQGQAFGFVPNSEDLAHWESVLHFERTLVAREGTEIIGTSATLPLPLTVPGGGIVNAAGVTMVTVAPSHRRRGVLTAMMSGILTAAHTRGEPLAMLWASESPIYGRFGYGLSVEDESWEIERAHARFASPPASGGAILLVDEAYARSRFPEAWERARGEQPGRTGRSDRLWEDRFRDPPHARGGGTPFFFAAYEEGGRLDGYALYRVNASWPDGIPSNEITVVEAVAASDAAHAALWRFLLDIDLSKTVRAAHRPTDDPLPHMLDDYRRLRRTRRDALWLRLVDVAQALAARSYGVSGSLVLDVRDDVCPWNPTRFALEGGAEGGHLAVSTAAPDLSLRPADLGAIYLGGQRPSTLARAGRIKEHRAGALLLADAMFASSQPPWCPQFF